VGEVKINIKNKVKTTGSSAVSGNSPLPTWPTCQHGARIDTASGHAI